jgi:hypothetical protein
MAQELLLELKLENSLRELSTSNSFLVMVMVQIVMSTRLFSRENPDISH